MLFHPGAGPAETDRRRSGIASTPAIRFRRAPAFVSSAFAFPGGPVTVTDGLADLLGDDELLAAIAHEFAHVEERHGLREALRVGGPIVAVSVVFAGDACGLHGAAGIFPPVATPMRWLRGFQTPRGARRPGSSRAAKGMRTRLRAKDERP